MYGVNNYSSPEYLLKKFDKRMLQSLVSLHSALGQDRLDMKNIMGLVDLIKHVYEDAKTAYINSLLFPETAISCKLPSLFPIPSSAFQMHFLATNIQVNALGNLAWTWNPYFLQDAGAANNFTTFYIDNNAALTGLAPDNNFLPVNLSYNQIPASVYGSFRVVSASIIISYVGRMDIVSGTLGIGVGLNNSGVATPSGVAAAVADAASQVFGAFAQVDNLYFKERTQAANGCRAIYFPIDDKYTYFLPVNTNILVGAPGALVANCYNTGFYFAGYASGLPVPPNQSLRFDMYVNYEALVVPGFNNYIPSTPGNSSDVDTIQTASAMLTAHPEKIVAGSSDIPAGGRFNVGSMDVMKEIAGGDVIPTSMETVARTLKYI